MLILTEFKIICIHNLTKKHQQRISIKKAENWMKFLPWFSIWENYTIPNGKIKREIHKEWDENGKKMEKCV